MPGHEGKIETRCPACDAKYRVPASGVGRQARCVRCRTTFRVVDHGHKPAYPDGRRPPTEDDILRWLNEGSDEDRPTPRPRIISGGDPDHPQSREDTSVSQPAAHPAEPAAPLSAASVDVAAAATGLPTASVDAQGLRKTG